MAQLLGGRAGLRTPSAHCVGQSQLAGGSAGGAVYPILISFHDHDKPHLHLGVGPGPGLGDESRCGKCGVNFREGEYHNNNTGSKPCL